jgi:hypothetical protein
MKLSKGEESTLLVAFTEALKDASITSYGYVRLPDKWEESTKSTFESEFEKKVYEKLDDGGLTSLLQNYILREFYRNGYELPARDRDAYPVTGYPLFQDYLSVSKSIVEIVKKTPLSYNIIIKSLNSLNNLNTKNFDELKISDRLKIVLGKNLVKDFQTSTGNDRLDE